MTKIHGGRDKEICHIFMFSVLMLNGMEIHFSVSKARASDSIPKGDSNGLHDLLPFSVAFVLFFLRGADVN